MSDTQTSKDGSVPSTDITPVVSHGAIADVVGFTKLMQGHMVKICGRRRKWATAEASSFLVELVGEYFDQLENKDDFNKEDLRVYFERVANMNGLYNELAKAQLIDRESKAPKVATVADLIPKS